MPDESRMVGATGSGTSISNGQGALAAIRGPVIRNAAIFGLVVCLAAAGALRLHAKFVSDGRYRWDGIDNDRNSHYLAGLRLGLDLRNGEWLAFARDYEKVRTWPPLHASCIALAVVIGGPRYETAVAPNLIAWVGMISLAFLVARRLAPAAGNAAGWTAAVFAAASPAHRVFAADFMLESLGACLTLLVVWLYLRWKQTENGSSAGLAVAGSLLFFEKYNYWLLVVLALAGAETLERRAPLWRWAVDLWRRGRIREWILGQARKPLNYLVLALLAITLASRAAPPGERTVAGVSFRVGGSGANLWQFSFVALLVRLAFSWKTSLRAQYHALPTIGRDLCKWHLAPIAIWFVAPKRLGYFLWYLGLNNGPNSDGKLSSAAEFYGKSLAIDYHLAWWSLGLAFSLILVLLTLAKRWRPGTFAVVLLLALGCALTLKHPNRKSRFLHTWVPAGWTLAGAGLGGAAIWGTRKRAGVIAPWAAAAASLAIAYAHRDGWDSSGHSPELGHWNRDSTLPIAEAYLDWFRNEPDCAIFGTVPMQDFAQWTFLERFPDRGPPEVGRAWFGESSEANRERFARWTRETHAQSVVLVDVLPESRQRVKDLPFHQEFRRNLEESGLFVRVESHRLPGQEIEFSRWARAPTAVTNHAMNPLR